MKKFRYINKKIVQVGNSVAVILPKDMARRMDFVPGAVVEVLADYENQTFEIRHQKVK